MSPRRATILALAGLLPILPAPGVRAQGWAADLYAGGTRHDALSGHVGATNLVANVRHGSEGGVLSYVSLAAPLDARAAFWGAAGAEGRPRARALAGRPMSYGRMSYGVEAGAHGYAFGDGEDGLRGGGAALHALPFLRLEAGGGGALELRAGRRQHLFSFADTSGTRGVFELGARGQVAGGVVGAQADVRWLRAPEAGYPYAGVQLSAALPVGRLGAWAGRWFAEELDGPVWGALVSVPVRRLGELWLTVRQDAADPFYDSSARSTWNLGFSRPLGGPRAAPGELLPRLVAGQVRIRLPESAVAGARGGAPSVAGEFSEWTPLPMRREGREWVLDLPLGPGVYRFAFVTEAGAWFVPEHYPGRMDDGMGGHVAVMVVP